MANGRFQMGSAFVAAHLRRDVRRRLWLNPKPRKSKLHGITTFGVEVTHVPTQGLRLLMPAEERLDAPFSEFPWFKKSTLRPPDGHNALSGV